MNDKVLKLSTFQYGINYLIIVIILLYIVLLKVLTTGKEGGRKEGGKRGRSTAPATGNIKMKCVCFHSKRVCFSSANVGVVFSLCLETRRKSPLLPLVPCSDNLKSSVYY